MAQRASRRPLNQILALSLPGLVGLGWLLDLPLPPFPRICSFVLVSRAELIAFHEVVVRI